MSTTPDTPPAGPRSDGHRPSSLLLLSNEMVRIYKERFGRGPTKARSNFVGPYAVICILENTFTPAEKSLQKMGEHQRLRDMRIFLQYASAEEFTGAVQRVLGRPVRGFISGVDTKTDIACELFTFDADPSTDGDSDHVEAAASTP
jgi:uncharacterized protein YbcI